MEMNKTRCHPSVIIENMGLAGWVIIFALIQQIPNINNFKDAFSEVKHGGKGVVIGFFLLLVLVILVILFQVNRWAKTYISIENNAIVLERNTMFKKVNTIGIKNISNINIEQNIFHRIVGTYRVKIDTNSRSTADKTDVKIVLSKKKAITFKAIIQNKMNLLKKEITAEQVNEEDFSSSQDFQEDYEVRQVTYNTGHIIKHCLLTVPIYSVLVTVGVIGAIIVAVVGGNIGGLSVQEMIMEFAGGSIAFIIFILTLATNGVRKYFQFYDFKVTRFKDRIAIEQGLLNHKRFEIPISKINAIKVVEPTLSRIFKMRSIELINIGMGNEKNEGSQLFLSATKAEAEHLLEQLLPEFVTSTDERVEMQPRSVRSFMLIKSMISVVVSIIGAIIWYECYQNYIMDQNTPWMLPIVMGVIILADLFVVFTYYMSYHTKGYYSGDDFVAITSGCYQRITHIIRYEKVQTIKLTQGPLERAYKVSRVMVRLLAAQRSSYIASGLFNMEMYDKLERKMVESYSMD